MPSSKKGNMQNVQKPRLQIQKDLDMNHNFVISKLWNLEPVT